MAVVSGVDAAVTRVGGDGRVDARLLRAVVRARGEGRRRHDVNDRRRHARAGDAQLLDQAVVDDEIYNGLVGARRERDGDVRPQVEDAVEEPLAARAATSVVVRPRRPALPLGLLRPAELVRLVGALVLLSLLAGPAQNPLHRRVVAAAANIKSPALEELHDRDARPDGVEAARDVVDAHRLLGNRSELLDDLAQRDRRAGAARGQGSIQDSLGGGHGPDGARLRGRGRSPRRVRGVRATPSHVTAP